MKAFFLSKKRPFLTSFATFVLGILLILGIQKVFADTTVIYACVNNVNGNMRVVQQNTTCRNDETPLNWNQQGIQGPPGQQGPPGTGNSSGLPFTCTWCNLSSLANTFQGKDFSNAQLAESNFANADIHGVIFKGAWLMRTDFSNANLTGADLSNLLSGSPSSHTDLIGGLPPGVFIYFTGANLTNANLSNDNFSHNPNPYVQQFSGTNLQNVNFTNTTFTGTDFTGAINMSTANFTNTTWSNTICPDGTNSDTNGTVPPSCIGHF